MMRKSASVSAFMQVLHFLRGYKRLALEWHPGAQPLSGVSGIFQHLCHSLVIACT